MIRGQSGSSMSAVVWRYTTMKLKAERCVAESKAFDREWGLVLALTW